MYNKYRYIVKWIYERIEKRYDANVYPTLVFIQKDFPIPNSFVEREMIQMGHEYEINRNDFTVEDATCNRDITLERLHLFTVTHEPSNKSFTVDIRNHRCTCHHMYWKKYPCIHYIAVIYNREDYTAVWKAVDDMYSRRETLKTCRTITSEENDVLKDIFKRQDVPKRIQMELRAVRGQIVKNRTRIYSKGEY